MSISRNSDESSTSLCSSMTLRIQASFWSLASVENFSPCLYFQCAAIPYSAMRCISCVLICISNGTPTLLRTVVCSDWYILDLGTEM